MTKKKITKKETAKIDGKWMRSVKFEELCADLECTWQESVLDLASVDWKGSEKNCGRLMGTDPFKVVVDEMSVAMLKGRTFEMVAFCRTPRGRILIVYGMRRTSATDRAGYKRIPAYDVNIEDVEMYRALSVASNSFEGERNSQSERLTQAVVLMEVYGYKIADAVRVMQLHEKSVASLRQKLNARSLQEKLLLAGYKKVVGLKESHVRTLASLKSSPVLAGTCAELAADFRKELNEDSLRDLARKVASMEGSEQSKLKYLEQVREEFMQGRSHSQGPRRGSTRRESFLGAFHRCLSEIRKTDSLDEIGVVGDVREKITGEWRELRTLGNKLFRRGRS